MPGLVPGAEAGAKLYEHTASARMTKSGAKTGIASGEENHDSKTRCDLRSVFLKKVIWRHDLQSLQQIGIIHDFLHE